MKGLKHPVKSLYHNELNLEDEIIASEEDYHRRDAEYRVKHKVVESRKFMISAI